MRWLIANMVFLDNAPGVDQKKQGFHQRNFLLPKTQNPHAFAIMAMIAAGRQLFMQGDPLEQIFRLGSPYPTAHQQRFPVRSESVA
jgi:hypothetical protein